MGLGRGHGFLAPAPWPLLGRTTTWPTRYDSAGVALTHTCHPPRSSILSLSVAYLHGRPGSRSAGGRGPSRSVPALGVCLRLGLRVRFTGPSLVLAPASCLLVCTWSQSPRGPSSALAARSRAPATVWLTVWRAVPPCGVCSPPRSRDGHCWQRTRSSNLVPTAFVVSTPNATPAGARRLGRPAAPRRPAESRVAQESRAGSSASEKYVLNCK